MYLRDLQAKFGGDVFGEVSAPLTRVGTLEHADESAITFLANPKYRHALGTTKAAAVIVSVADADVTEMPRIVSDNPYAYFAKVATLFAPRPAYAPGLHASAVVATSARIAASASIAEFVSIGEHATIGEGVRIGPGCVVGDNAVIGEGSTLVARVTIYHAVQIGKRAIIHAGAVIGADGFGFANERRRWLKIPQTGRVVIGDDCEIGANTTIDRGAIEDTIIGNGVKFDNQIQVGHNCRIGDHSIVAGCTGIAGSTIIGERVMIGGAVSITGHLTICDDVVLSANALVAKSITEPGMYSAGFPLMPHKEWLKNAAQIRHLDDLAKDVRTIKNANKTGE
jgi:UDP-3-O-[3-hydroxymyristoyl] glucosamine N-acyltransferase